jgi:poly(A) polymerase
MIPQSKISFLFRKRKFVSNHAKNSVGIVRTNEWVALNDDINFVGTIIRYHMSAYLKSIGEDESPNRGLYRYFQETGDLGVLLGFFHLADIIATYEGTLASIRWRTAISSVERILDGWFNHYEDVISPTRLITGDELIEEFGMNPGRKIGIILEKIREEQAAGVLSEKKMALDYAKKIIEEMKTDD